MRNTVIFDLDGLLIDSEIISFRIYQDLTRDCQQHISMETYAQNYSGKTEIHNVTALIEEFKIPISVEEGMAFVAAKEKEYLKEGVALKQGARKLLSYLKNNQYKIVLATSSTRERALNILDQNNVTTYFDYMVFATDVKRGKPNPDIFLKACEYAGEPPKNCLVLEDSEAGIQAAHAANIEVICIPDMKKPDEAFRKMAAAEFASLEAVIPWLEK